MPNNALQATRDEFIRSGGHGREIKDLDLVLRLH
jgi:hypothetical protein